MRHKISDAPNRLIVDFDDFFDKENLNKDEINYLVRIYNVLGMLSAPNLLAFPKAQEVKDIDMLWMDSNFYNKWKAEKISEWNTRDVKDLAQRISEITFSIKTLSNILLPNFQRFMGYHKRLLNELKNIP